MTQVFQATRAVLPDGEGPATIVVEDGMITSVTTSLIDVAGATVIPGDEVLIPGLVDTHVHVNQPGRTEWEGFHSATRAAAAGGVTTLIDMPLNSIPSTTTVAALAEKQRAAAPDSVVNVGFWGGVIPANLGTGELRRLWDRGVFGFKCFLLHSGVDEFPPLNPVELRRAMAEIAEFDGLIIVHAEDAETIAEYDHDVVSTYSSFLTSRPATAERRAIATVIGAAEATGCRAHILHLSDADSLELLAGAQQRGVRVTAETCPHYLALFAEAIGNGATQYKCCPPIRTAGNRERLWKGLVDGVISTVVSDHSPCTVELKKFAGITRDPGWSALAAPGVDLGGSSAGGSFGEAWGGISSVQLGLPVVWSEARKRGLSLSAVVGWMAGAPATWAGLDDRGTIEAGRRADFASIRADDAFVVLPETLHQRNKVSAYLQHTLAGVVTRTWIAGALIFSHGEFPGGPQPFTLRSNS